ncbi:MAG: tol-pal system protein YbgF [Pseudorhodoplanes sp.]
MRHTTVFAALTALAWLTAPAAAQMAASDLVMRLDALENQVRQLTGQIEQLQYRNQQLEQMLRAMPPQAQVTPQAAAPRAAAPQAADPSPIRPVAPAAPGRRTDVYDPNENPNLPGAPRTLGSLPPGQPSAPLAPNIATDESGAARSREPGAPLDLSTMSNAQQRAGGQYASVAPPSQSPRDQFDLGYGYIQRKDYALAEEALREFVRRYPSDRLTADANFWLGESLFQRQRYRDAAEFYLTVSTKYETSAKAPDSLLRLGQSLAAIGERDAACATLGEVERKYPRAPLPVKQGVEREIKRVRC